MTTKDEIRTWLLRAKEEGATHMLVVCDSFDHSDYPVNVMPGETAIEKKREYDEKVMDRVMELYCLDMDFTSQLAEKRAYHPEYTVDQTMASFRKTPDKPADAEPRERKPGRSVKDPDNFNLIHEGENVTWTLRHAARAPKDNICILQRIDVHDADITTTIYLPEELLEQYAKHYLRRKLDL